MPPAQDAERDESNQEVLGTKTTVLFCGSTKWDIMGRQSVPASVASAGGSEAGSLLLAPHVIPELTKQQIKKVVSGPVSCHLFAIDSAGVLYGWGRNENGQLGLDDLTRKDRPTVVEFFSDTPVADIALGRNHTVVLTAKGEVFTMGSNRSGQLGLGSMQPEQASEPRKVDLRALTGAKAVGVAAGADFSVIIDEGGGVYTFGHPEHGQLGHGSDGAYIEGKRTMYNFETSPRMIESLRRGDTKVEDVKCGVNHSVALDKDGKVWTWGMGGYGRLGHRVPGDEMVPRCIANLNQVCAVYAGSKFCYSVNKFRQTHFWGQARSAGEATMYPKPLHDLTGWEVRGIGCGASSTMVAAGESVISWGGSPCFGELGYGEQEKRLGSVVKSSTKPKLVDSLEGCHAVTVAMGLSFSAIVVRHETEGDDKIVAAHASLDDAAGGEAAEEVAAGGDDDDGGAGGKARGAAKKRKAAAPKAGGKTSTRAGAKTASRKRRR